ncbi:hypothetical protein TWF730_003187 [Orbilia blumenaviensis]|uniref:Uncharacterized protein n=1 Tax=Orbilia blumenaviensis TaxID=1796055 RepID=A0AAV9U545_9PEZI
MIGATPTLNEWFPDPSIPILLGGSPLHANNIPDLQTTGDQIFEQIAESTRTNITGQIDTDNIIIPEEVVYLLADFKSVTAR